MNMLEGGELESWRRKNEAGSGISLGIREEHRTVSTNTVRPSGRCLIRGIIGGCVSWHAINTLDERIYRTLQTSVPSAQPERSLGDLEKSPDQGEMGQKGPSAKIAATGLGQDAPPGGDEMKTLKGRYISKGHKVSGRNNYNMRKAHDTNCTIRGKSSQKCSQGTNSTWFQTLQREARVHCHQDTKVVRLA